MDPSDNRAPFTGGIDAGAGGHRVLCNGPNKCIHIFLKMGEGAEGKEQGGKRRRSSAEHLLRMTHCAFARPIAHASAQSGAGMVAFDPMHTQSSLAQWPHVTNRSPRSKFFGFKIISQSTHDLLVTRTRNLFPFTLFFTPISGMAQFCSQSDRARLSAFGFVFARKIMQGGARALPYASQPLIKDGGTNA